MAGAEGTRPCHSRTLGAATVTVATRGTQPAAVVAGAGSRWVAGHRGGVARAGTAPRSRGRDRLVAAAATAGDSSSPTAADPCDPTATPHPTGPLRTGRAVGAAAMAVAPWEATAGANRAAEDTKNVTVKDTSENVFYMVQAIYLLPIVQELAMGSPWTRTWLVCGGLVALAGGHTSNSTFTTQLLDDRSRSRALGVEERQDYGSYYQSYAAPSPGTYGPPPVYGPPPPTIPEGMVHIEFAFDEIVLRCISEEPFEHIAWIRYPCPQQFMFGGEGEHVADGSSVYQSDLYDVHVRAHDGSVVSELLIKRPLAENSEGIYQCEAWPHVHGGGYASYGQTTYQAPKSNIFIIGGDSLLEQCYHVSSYTHSNNKLHGIDNKQGANDDKLKTNLKMITLKPRRNTTDERKDSNSKQLRYNLKYVDNTLYDLDGVNVTGKFFRPINRTFTESVGLSENVVNTSNWN